MSEKKAEPAAEGAAKKGGKGMLFVVLGVVLLLAGGGGAYFFLVRQPALDAESEAATEEGHGAAAGEHGAPAGGHGGSHGKRGVAEMGAMEALDPFIANLADEDGRRYLKATMQLEFYESSVPDELSSHMAQVRDLILTLFTSKTFADIRTPEGKGLLREEIINRINRVLRRDVVKAVYFTEFIVQ